jgi:hypothetical protein
MRGCVVHATGSKDQLNVTQAEAEAVIQPDGMLDDLDWKAKAAVRVGRGRHAKEAAISNEGRHPDNAAWRVCESILASSIFGLA